MKRKKRDRWPQLYNWPIGGRPTLYVVYSDGSAYYLADGHWRRSSMCVGNIAAVASRINSITFNSFRRPGACQVQAIRRRHR